MDKVAYKIWHDERNYIHKDSTATDVKWTTNSKDAKHFGKDWYSVLTDEYGFNLHKRYDKLHVVDWVHELGL